MTTIFFRLDRQHPQKPNEDVLAVDIAKVNPELTMKLASLDCNIIITLEGKTFKTPVNIPVNIILKKRFKTYDTRFCTCLIIFIDYMHEKRIFSLSSSENSYSSSFLLAF